MRNAFSLNTSSKAALLRKTCILFAILLQILERLMPR
jgi:hypothetical protein